MNEPLVRIYLENGNVVFESTTDKVVAKKLYPSGRGRIGVVVIDVKNNVTVSKEAFEPLQRLYETAPRAGGSLGDIDMFEATDSQYCLSWIGHNKRVFIPGEEVCKGRDTVFVPEQFTILD